MKTWVLLALGALLLLTTSAPLCAQPEPAPLKQEFRGAWIATVLGLDWPSERYGAPQAQRQQLVQMLDSLKATGINAVIFQVRPEGDALYYSEMEPWSYWLTGRQGQAPGPFYDPLQFAIQEAHRRGMELHAWFNPFRSVRNTDTYELSPHHISETHPEWHLTFGTLKILNPGLPEVRDYVTRVIMDVVQRYDVDGVHFDDYFYPTDPPISSEDRSTFEAYNRGFDRIEDWRRDNINLFVAQVYDSIKAVKPLVKFGISPFGIWKSGVPEGICGLDAYDVIYGDGVAWLNARTVDYLAPQLYWAIGGRSSCGSVDYIALANWWAQQTNGRHFYIGNAVYKADETTWWGIPYTSDELPRQVRYAREHEGIQGNIFYRTVNLYELNSAGFADSLETDLYSYPALTPTMPWLDQTPPGAPQGLTPWLRDDRQQVLLTWAAPNEAEAFAAPRFYAVYRVQAAETPVADSVVQDVRHLIGVTGETRYVDPLDASVDPPYHYVVTALSANSVEGAPSRVVSLTSPPVSASDGEEQSYEFRLHQNYPNPFNPTTHISFTLAEPQRVTLRIVNSLGQHVRTLVAQEPCGLGTHTIAWNGTNETGQPVASGLYFYVLEAGEYLTTKTMMLVK